MVCLEYVCLQNQTLKMGMKLHSITSIQDLARQAARLYVYVALRFALAPLAIKYVCSI